MIMDIPGYTFICNDIHVYMYIIVVYNHQPI